MGFAGSLIACFSSFNDTKYYCTEARQQPDDYYNYEELCRQSKEIKGEVYSSGAFLIFVGYVRIIVDFALSEQELISIYGMPSGCLHHRLQSDTHSPHAVEAIVVPEIRTKSINSVMA